MLRSALPVVLIACHSGAPSRTLANASPQREDPCDLVEAMLAIDNAGYQKIYAGCSGARLRIVDVRGPTSLIPPNTTCVGRSFSLFHGEREVRGPIIRLDMTTAGRSWRFVASLYQPNPTATDDGGFESTQYYCGAIGGFVEWTGGHWRTFVEVDG